MPEIAINEVHEALKALRSEVQGVTETALEPELKAKLTNVLDEYEDVKQKQVVAEEQTTTLKQQVDELTESVEKKAAEGADIAVELKALQLAVSMRDDRGGSDLKAWKDSDEYKALTDWSIRPDNVSLEQKAILRTDSDTAGGFLVPVELERELQREIVELDPVRAAVRVRSITSKTLEMPVRISIPQATWEGEAEEDALGISGYRLVTATPFRQSITVPATLDMLMNGAFDMEAELTTDAAEGMAEGEGQAVIAGTGHKQPEGITTNDIVVTNKMTDVDTSVDADFANSIINITGELKVGYNPLYLLHRRTLARIRTLRDTNGQFLWQPGLNGPVANTLNGFSYILCPTMDAWDTAGGDVLVFADLRRGYTIVDRTGVSVVRDEVTEARKAIVNFTFHRWLTGIVTMPEAIKLQRNT